MSLSSCSSGEKERKLPEPEVEVGAARDAGDGQELRLPLDPYSASPVQAEILDRAQGVLKAKCMKRYGFSYAPPPLPKTDPVEGIGNRYGISDPAVAAKFGYGGPDAGVQAEEPPLGEKESFVLNGPDELDPDSLPDSQEEVDALAAGGSAKIVNGVAVPPGGCLRESFLKLYAPQAGAVDIIFTQNLERESFARSRSDSRVKEAASAWSACMRKSGYEVSDPMNPGNELNLTEDLSGEEAVATAVKDVDCKKRTNFIRRWFEVESAYQREILEREAETLKKAKAEHEARMRLAASLVK
ncbi:MULTISPECIES: hypothetical protein [Streptomyces]|uniref:Uncharacterized protein n=1 Tax=Streptomyces cavourensis TaxID=67258 RepID=A0ABY5F3T0_9ACTN|nr:hypothetical protein [Streptomyces cavourensis]UTR78339.1 hypothetical protein NLU04_07690 [Streptomyces cavourensis]